MSWQADCGVGGGVKISKIPPLNFNRIHILDYTGRFNT
jgi:hypothetical protein